MAGRHKWSDLKKRMTPEQRQRMAAEAAKIDVTMPPDEPCSVTPLRMLRELEDAPCSEYAAELQTDEAGVSAFEECDDALVSQVAAYIKAMGGRMKVVAEFPNGDEVIIANFYRKRRWPIRANELLFGDLHFEADTATGPTTYGQIEWAAQTYRQHEAGRKHDAAYRQVYTRELRDALLNGKPESAIKRMLDFLNQINADSDMPAETLFPILVASVPETVAGLRHLASATLYDIDGDGLSDWDSALLTRAADRLMADDAVDFPLASQILSVANPALFLPWNLATHSHFFPKNDPDDGFAAVRYSRFICKMADAARSIRKDALTHHDINDPAVHLSTMLGIDPPHTLAKFIGEYNWMTITAGLQEQDINAAAVAFGEPFLTVRSQGERRVEMTNTIAPTTYLQIRKATLAYYDCQKCSKYVRAYRNAYNSALGQALLERCDYEGIAGLRYFLRVFDALQGMTIDEAIRALMNIVPDTVSFVKHEGLDGLDLVTDRFSLSTRRAVSRVFDLLCEPKGISLTTASKILAVINPNFFVMWDRKICEKYFPGVSLARVTGDTYTRFLTEMKRSTHLIEIDARKHKVHNPEKSISDAVGQSPPFPMTKLIDNYNWITLVHATKCAFCKRAIL